jgi:hypothetical protein
LYLASYGVIDTIDSLIKRCNLYYVSWKYWHSCKLHVQALGLVVAYDMYCEVVQEGFAAFGFENKDAAKKCVLDFHTAFCWGFWGLEYIILPPLLVGYTKLVNNPQCLGNP